METHQLVRGFTWKLVYQRDKKSQGKDRRLPIFPKVRLWVLYNCGNESGR